MGLKLIIAGKPVIQQRPRLGRFGNFYDPGSKERKELSAKLLAGRQRNGLYAPYDGDLSVRVCFFYKPHGRRKVDLDNLCKAILDSGNNVLWIDDSQIQHLDLWKTQVDEINERTELEIIGL